MKQNNEQSLKLNLDELKIESFVTSIDSEMNMRLFGGFGSEEHPTHTEQTDDEHHFCTTMIC
jgi:hypothetical protein